MFSVNGRGSSEQVGWGYAARETFAGAVPADRLDFLRKVYSLFFYSIIVAGVGGYIGLYHMLGATVGLSGFGLGVIEIVLLLLCLAFQATPGLNFVMLTLFTLVSGITVAPALAGSIAATHGTAVIQQAYFLTLAVFGGLTGYVFAKRADFSYLGGFLFVGLIGLVLAGIFNLFLGSSAVHLFLSWITLFLFCGFVLFDTSRILHHYRDGQEVGAAIALYLDFVNLFLALLSILSSRRD